MKKPFSILVEGDPFAPLSCDLIVEQITLPLDQLPVGDGWRLMSGNLTDNYFCRVAYRREVEDDRAKK